jgi:hypothetical protein
MNRPYTIVASILTGLTLVLAYCCIRLRWQPRADFDIIGFLWLVQNILPLTLVVLTLFIGGAAIHYWLRSRLEE